MLAQVLCGGDEIRKALSIALNLKGNPRRVRIMCLNMEDVEILSNERVKEVLSRLLVQGIIVTIILGTKPGKKKLREFFYPLYELGANIYYNERVHAKMILTEGKTRNLAIVMSANITHGGLHYKYEVGVSLFRLTQFIYEKLRNYSNSVLGAESTRWLLHVV